MRRIMKVTFDGVSELAHYKEMLDSCVTEEMIIPNTEKVKIIIHTPRSLLKSKVR